MEYAEWSMLSGMERDEWGEREHAQYHRLRLNKYRYILAHMHSKTYIDMFVNIDR